MNTRYTDDAFELWTEPYLGEMEVLAKYKALEEANAALELLVGQEPNWATWIDTRENRTSLRDHGHETCQDYFDN